MRSKSAVLFALVVCLTAGAASAQITRLAPSTFYVGNIEDFLTIHGENLKGTELTEVAISGPGGSFRFEASVVEPTYVISWVPEQVLMTEGRYTVDVYVKDVDVPARHYGTLEFDVIQRVIEAPPLLLIPEAVAFPASSANGATVTYEASAISLGSGGGPITVSCSPASGTFFPYGLTTVHCTASDLFGIATGSFPVFVYDTTAPTITVPADIVSSNPVVTYSVSAVDDIDGPVTNIHCSRPSGSTFPFGQTIVTCEAFDNHSNSAVGTFKVTILGGPPVMTLPDNITVEATGPGGAAVTFNIPVTENGVVTCSPASGSTFALGETTVNCTATNSVGSSTGSFDVSVVDNTGPALTLPADLQVSATSAAGAAVSYSATASDLVDGNVAISCAPASGQTFPLGVTIVQCNAVDLSGNASTGSFHVTVLDTTPPVISLVEPSITNIWPPNHQMVPVTITVVATDNVDPNPVSTIISVTSNHPNDISGDGSTSPDWVITGPLTVNLRAERVTNNDRTYTITVKSTDASGNSSTATTVVTVAQQSRGRAVR